MSHYPTWIRQQEEPEKTLANQGGSIYIKKKDKRYTDDQLDRMVKKLDNKNKSNG